LEVFRDQPSHLNNNLFNLPEEEAPIMTISESKNIHPIDIALARDAGLTLHDDALNFDFIG